MTQNIIHQTVDLCNQNRVRRAIGKPTNCNLPIGYARIYASNYAIVTIYSSGFWNHHRLLVHVHILARRPNDYGVMTGKLDAKSGAIRARKPPIYSQSLRRRYFTN